MNIQERAQKDFSKSVVNKLAKKGIEILSTCAVPDQGNFFDMGRAYRLNDRGTHRICYHHQVLAMANSSYALYDSEDDYLNASK